MGNSNTVLNGNRAKLRRLGRSLLDEFVENCVNTEMTEDERTMSVKTKVEELLKDYSLPSIRLISIEKLAQLKSFPCFSADQSLTVELDIIDRDSSFVVFVSHCWLRSFSGAEGWDGKPHPDDSAGSQFELCVDGIQKLKSVYAPRMKDCYVWIDYSCLSQDGNAADEVELEEVMKYCDCIFTPIVDPAHHKWKAPFPLSGVSAYRAHSFLTGSHAYLNRSWCRLEMLYAANVPVQEFGSTVINRHTLFEGALAAHNAMGRRPHFLYGTKEHEAKETPLLLPPLRRSFKKEYHPLKGNLTVPSDKARIQFLLTELQPLLDANQLEVGYRGDLNGTGERHGYGACLAASGELYEGEWNNGKRHGLACLTNPDGSVFEGEFKDGKRYGHGTHRSYDGSLYDGEWKNDMMCGQGTYRFADGSTYVGMFQFGKYCGKGTFKCASSGVYEGEWKNGKRHGRGTNRSADGNTYVGEWLEDHQHGLGVMRYADGDTYEGHWQAGKRHGKGKLVSSDSTVYEGDWCDDEQHGHGTLHFADGSVYDGGWTAGNMDGRGVLKYHNGRTYSGMLHNGVYHGQGTFHYENGDVYEGNWDKGNRQGQGLLRYASGDVYDGEWERGMRHGAGTFQSIEGVVEEGLWEHDKFCEVIWEVSGKLGKSSDD